MRFEVTQHLSNEFASSKPIVDSLLIHQKEQLLEEIKKIPMGVKKNIEFNRKVVPPRLVEDPLGDTLVTTTLNIEDVKDVNVHVQPPEKIYIQVPLIKKVRESLDEHKGFWKKLKLLFSKKIVYTKRDNLESFDDEEIEEDVD